MLTSEDEHRLHGSFRQSFTACLIEKAHTIMLQKPDLTVNTQLCLALADFVESLPRGEPNLEEFAVTPPPGTKPNYFSMRVLYRKEECGTIACICGSLAYIVGNDAATESFDVAGEHLGISRLEAKKLFTPTGWQESNITSCEAAKVIRHLALTGEVNWDIIRKDGDDGGQDSNSV